MNVLDGKTAVITGGASGIGEATVKLFVKEGARVVIADIDDEKGQELASALGPSVRYEHTDMTSESDVSKTFTTAVDQFGKVDFLFNNVGGGAFTPAEIENVSVDAYDRIMKLSVRSTFLGMKYAAPIMQKQASGSIANNASVAGLYAGYATHLYSAAKAAVIHLTRSVAVELGECGVRVNCICPGAVFTPLLLQRFKIADDQNEEKLEMLKQALSYNQPIRRPCFPEDIAQTALWLAGDESGFMNGHALVVDGGMTGGRQWSLVQKHRQAMGPTAETGRKGSELKKV